MIVLFWNIEALTGYKPQTTFWMDFSIADQFGEKSVRDTYNRAFSEWKNNHVFLTELVMVLNWKLWQHYENGNQNLAKLYNDLWVKSDGYAVENLHGDELSYYYMTTD